MIERTLLIEAFQAAQAAALAADPGEAQDGGTCNFDTPILTVPGLPAATAKQCAEAAGITVEPIDWLGKRRFMVYTALNGQGNRRTAMAEAAARALKAKGLTAQVYYQMD